LGEADELFKIKLLIERANIKYANLLEEFQSKGLETITVRECMDFMRRTVDKEILDRILNILLMRGYIQVINGRYLQ
jgi:chemotaxis methyl-accepting protein methylase